MIKRKFYWRYEFVLWLEQVQPEELTYQERKTRLISHLQALNSPVIAEDDEEYD